MNETKQAQHTPGPWTLRRNRGQFQSHAVNAPSHMTIANVWAGSDTPDFANARLIAAAPDLLAALEQVLDESGRASGTKADLNSHLNYIYQVARAAITKAKG